MYALEQVWLRMGYTPESFQWASLRQVFAVVRAWRSRQRSEWEHTVMLYCQIRNVHATKRSDVLSPEKVLKDMFGTREVADRKVDLMDKFRMLALQTGGRDHRKAKG